MLIERTGFNPPTCQVEENIKEIAQRILDREAELATRMQVGVVASLWRLYTTLHYTTLSLHYYTKQQHTILLGAESVEGHRREKVSRRLQGGSHPRARDFGGVRLQNSENVPGMLGKEAVPGAKAVAV